MAQGNTVDPFQYKPLGSLAYIGDRRSGIFRLRLLVCRQTSNNTLFLLIQVMELPGGWSFGGFVAWFAWRSAYLTKQVLILISPSQHCLRLLLCFMCGTYPGELAQQVPCGHGLDERAYLWPRYI